LKLPVSVEIACEVEIACVKLKLPVSHTLFLALLKKEMPNHRRKIVIVITTTKVSFVQTISLFQIH